MVAVWRKGQAREKVRNAHNVTVGGSTVESSKVEGQLKIELFLGCESLYTLLSLGCLPAVQ